MCQQVIRGVLTYVKPWGDLSLKLSLEVTDCLWLQICSQSESLLRKGKETELGIQDFLPTTNVCHYCM